MMTQKEKRAILGEDELILEESDIDSLEELLDDLDTIDQDIEDIVEGSIGMEDQW